MKCFEKTWCKNSGEINLRAISGPGDGLRARRTLVQVCVENFRASMRPFSDRFAKFLDLASYFKNGGCGKDSLRLKLYGP